ncbi:glycoside hydrolase family 3 N-terminal domain-containing protein [Curtobacterium sp. MCBD17_003]|uniref:glycoside hydrolase family 3 N-terminal domain-containing protein n=1 Tax=Curtobacterium sp. MCBD17_003 TaxID=2175667 RepID=UPI000DAA2B6E|nr:glycoside hydrolase family 3 N-terminal domain-containing protein [Curtobacterium sp. MCBD17_003]WIE53983.1 glycoside hydrolase family 3 N-terminal domain-containing protein [Curtobacterium sp. MCBD17_003]
MSVPACSVVRRRARPFLAAATTLVVASVLSACVGPSTPGGPSPRSSRPASASPSRPTGTPTPTPTPDPLAGLTLEQRVGQLFMVGTPATAAGAQALEAVRTHHVGNVFLSGRSTSGTAATAAAVRQVTDLVSDDTTAGLPMLVATDQEGGQVQVLRGPGFSDIPDGLAQGAMPPAALHDDAVTWGRQLAAAGVDLDLGPVVDLLPSPATAAANPPIGRYRRELGFDPGTITGAADAFRGGLQAAGVQSVVKHFPGLGNVTGNTDYTSGVTDSVTTADSPSVQVFRDEVHDGARFVMTSTAYYSRIDPSMPAAFSPTVVQGLLRGQLGFDGVVVTDDLSTAAQVQQWTPAQRAVLAIQAGSDIVLASADPSVVDPMVDAVVAKARTDASFRQQVDAAARRVIQAKQQSLG